MEDLDPPREPPGAAREILANLQAHGLTWDGDVLWQSRRSDAYRAALHELKEAGLLFRCDCTRAQLAKSNYIYQGRCRDRNIPADRTSALRVRVGEDSRVRVEDAIQAPLEQDLARDVGDFILQRKDGLFAYQLAVVVDDAEQGVTDILRGSDLYDSTPRQVYLQRLLGLPTPRYAHIPVITNREGNKLSKQTFAPPLDNARALENLRSALRFLGQPVPGARSIEALLDTAAAQWRLDAIPAVDHIPESSPG